ncbi:MAG: hypothetical protein FWG90_09170 [Oscillospiraceae bacterium]|nr:hypothetical protein [Oscillospiraceae bacterium]
MGMTNEQYNAHLRQIYLSARKVRKYNLPWDEFIAELEAIAGPENVAMVKEKMGEFDESQNQNQEK